MDLDKWRKAGAIARRVLVESSKEIKVGKKVIEIVDAAEKKIYEYGAKPAFPVNLSINNIAAHYTPSFNDETVIPLDAVVKLDVGAHIDGCIGDTALTVDLSQKRSDMLETNQRALDKAIEIIKAGTMVKDIGKLVEEEIKKGGFKPIENLTGHQLKEYTLHAGATIPNTNSNYSYVLKEGDIIALEPFVTESGKAGRVKDKNVAEIFSLEKKMPCRLKEAKKVIEFIDENYKTLPFAERWIHREFNTYVVVRASLSELIRNGSLHAYPVLEEASGGIVSQFEHTVVVQKDGCEILTK